MHLVGLYYANIYIRTHGPQNVKFTKRSYWVMSDLYIPGVLISP